MFSLSRKLSSGVPNRRHSATSAGVRHDAARVKGQLPEEWLQRSELIMGADALNELARSTVTVVGLGGVGSWCAEMLCRSGVGHLVLVDGDVVDSSNRNRQLPALSSTIGRSKVEVQLQMWCRSSQWIFASRRRGPCVVQIMAERLRDINPAISITAQHMFLEPHTACELAGCTCDYLVDCIDSIAPKVRP
jgi:tRNA threonylcarbamoyladenosine dehydratase